MVQGGARPRSGPAPSLDSLNRQRDGAEWVKLDPKGYQGPIPSWPAHMKDQTEDEASLWQRLWRTPQATVWSADGVADTVALYCRCLIEAGTQDASTSVRTLVRQQQDALLLSIPALHSARYVIDAKIGGASPAFTHPELQTGTEAGRSPGSARDRFTIVPTPPEDSQE